MTTPFSDTTVHPSFIVISTPFIIVVVSLSIFLLVIPVLFYACRHRFLQPSSPSRPPIRELILPSLLKESTPVTLPNIGSLSATSAVVVGSIPRFTRLPRSMGVHEALRRSMEMVCRGSLWDFDEAAGDQKEALNTISTFETVDLEAAQFVQKPAAAKLPSRVVTSTTASLRSHICPSDMGLTFSENPLINMTFPPSSRPGLVSQASHSRLLKAALALSPFPKRFPLLSSLAQVHDMTKPTNAKAES